MIILKIKLHFFTIMKNTDFLFLIIEIIANFTLALILAIILKDKDVIMGYLAIVTFIRVLVLDYKN